MDLSVFDRLIYGCAGQMLVGEQNQEYFQTSFEALAEYELVALYPVGELDSKRLGLVLLKDIPNGFCPAPLRKLLSIATSEQEYVQLSRAAQLITWHYQHQFCGCCGTKTQAHHKDLALECHECGLVQYPRISPCIIVLVKDGERCLLARAPHFPEGRFSTLAGFIEAGETAEQAVHREVLEEVGIEIQNVRYIESQSWPFPHSLMLGFFADYKAGELKPDGIEIEAAHWYAKTGMPDTPPSFSISSKLIQRFLQGEPPT